MARLLTNPPTWVKREIESLLQQCIRSGETHDHIPQDLIDRFYVVLWKSLWIVYRNHFVSLLSIQIHHWSTSFGSEQGHHILRFIKPPAAIHTLYVLGAVNCLFFRYKS